MINKDLAIKLMNYYGGITYEELLTLIPNSCSKCKSTKINFYGYNQTEAVWKCLKCGDLISVPYNISKNLFFLN